MSSENQPNLLFIFTDEQAINTMKAYGNDFIQTPNLDRLASESIVFENPYVTQPVCTPSRSTIMTGLYPHETGCTENNIPLGSETPCLPEMGDFQDYKTAYHGKWHLGDEVFAQHGFEEWKSIEDYFYRDWYSKNRDQTKHSTYADFLIKEGFKPDIKTDDGFRAFSREFAARLPERYTKPAYLGKETSDFLDKNKNNPFILYVNFLRPHMPFFGPRDNQYNAEKIPLPENFDHELTDDLPLKLKLFQKGYYENGHSGLSLKTRDDWRKMIANYWGLVSLVDKNVGKILDTLEQNNLAEETIVVFTSDHGDMMGSHRLLGKCTMFEEAVKVPLMMKIPGLKADKVDNPASQIDLVPTLLDFMNQPIPDHLQGNSWRKFLENNEEPPEKDVFIEWNGYNTGHGNDQIGSAIILDSWKEMASKEEINASLGDPVRSVITPDGWKFNFSTIGDHELYNLNEDPHELNNLANDPEYTDIIAKLKDKIFEWQENTGDKVDFNRNEN